MEGYVRQIDGQSLSPLQFLYVSFKVKRIFAGAKGVGRFSCDRLGRFLNLVNVKDETKPKIENLIVNWEDFENADEEEFIKIKVTHDH